MCVLVGIPLGINSSVVGRHGLSWSGSMTGTVGFVLRWFWRVWSKWPFVMGIDVGGCRRRVAAVSPGKLVRKPWFKACSRVERAGENIVAGANATSSAVVDAPTRFAR